MEAAPYLIFGLRESLYAVEAKMVSEVVPLTEITPVDESPACIVGMANLRGRLLPVIDLSVRFGHQWQPYRIDHCIVVLERAGQAVGVIVDAARTVRDIDGEEIVAASLYSPEPFGPDPRLVQGVVKTREQVVMVLHLETLLSFGHDLAEPDGIRGDSSSLLITSTTSEEKAEFLQRSRRLAQPVESSEPAGRLSLAVVRIGEEFFGIALNAIREFAELGNVTPVPCCPEYVVGQMNLRGDLITVLDVAGVLGLPPLRELPGRKVVVMSDPWLAGGVLVDELLDVLYLNGTELGSSPRTLGEVGREHLRGTAMHGTRMFTLIDLPALLTHGDLTVNETP
jgi:purine-binding chemotaxis protein CheW